MPVSPYDPSGPDNIISQFGTGNRETEKQPCVDSIEKKAKEKSRSHYQAQWNGSFSFKTGPRAGKISLGVLKEAAHNPDMCSHTDGNMSEGHRNQLQSCLSVVRPKQFLASK